MRRPERDDQPVLIDFGEARKSLQQAPNAGLTQRRAKAERLAGGSAEGAAGSPELTREYSAAEQLTSRAVDASTDIYALAELSYLALTGTQPPSVTDRMAHDRYEPLAGRVVGADLAWLRGIDRGLALNPQDRPPTVAAWRAMLNESPARHRARAAAFVAGALGAVALVWWMVAPVSFWSPAPAPTTSDAQTPTEANIAASVDEDRTLAELRRAAVGGDPDAQATLGLRLLDEDQAERDPPAAVRWLSQAANQNHAPAQYNLGGLYDRGYGVEENPRQAAALYGQAAEQNHALAQYSLGRLT